VPNVEAAMQLGAALKALVDNGHLSLSGWAHEPPRVVEGCRDQVCPSGLGSGRFRLTNAAGGGRRRHGASPVQRCQGLHWPKHVSPAPATVPAGTQLVVGARYLASTPYKSVYG
jgi:hypothetical protein